LVTGPGSITTTVYQGQPDPLNGNTLANCTTAAAMPNGSAGPFVCKQAVQSMKLDNASSGSSGPSYIATDVLVLDAEQGALTDTTGQMILSGSGYTISSAQKHIGSSSFLHAAGNGYLITPANDTLALGTGDFSLSGWFYFLNWDTANGYAILFDTRSASDGGGGTWYGISGEFIAVSTAPLVNRHGMTLNTWNHIEFRRVSGIVTTYVNDVPVGTASDATNHSNNTIAIGACSFSPIGACPFTGYIDDVKVSKLVKTEVVFPGVDLSVPAQVSSYTYDASGRVLTAKDSLNKTTSYVYYPDTAFTGVDPAAVGHTIGDLQTITDAKGLITTFNSYDKSGRVLQMTDPKGIVTAMTYYPRGWIKTVTVTPPGGAARLTTYTYDNVGQLTGVNNPDGTTIGYTYDPAHRLVGAKDARGNSVTYTLDNVGNRISEQLKDPGGVLQRSMSRSFDALNRVQQLQVQ
jgi:YD repeat-containing protein